jgi:hypothetical protein
MHQIATTLKKGFLMDYIGFFCGLSIKTLNFLKNNVPDYLLRLGVSFEHFSTKCVPIFRK